MEEMLLTKDIVIYGKTIRTSNQNLEAIGPLWQEIMSEQNQIEMFGVYHNYESDFNGAYDLTVGSTQALPEYTELVIPEGNYLVIKTETNDVLGVQKAWEVVWQNPAIERAYTFDFEWYHADGSIELYIAIK